MGSIIYTPMFHGDGGVLANCSPIDIFRYLKSFTDKIDNTIFE